MATGSTLLSQVTEQQASDTGQQAAAAGDPERRETSSKSHRSPSSLPREFPGFEQGLCSLQVLEAEFRVWGSQGGADLRGKAPGGREEGRERGDGEETERGEAGAAGHEGGRTMEVLVKHKKESVKHDRRKKKHIISIFPEYNSFPQNHLMC